MKKNYRFGMSEDAKVDMTSMLDIVFILLIFFIVTTSFVKETGLIAKRPNASISSPENLSFSLYITEAGRLIIDHREVEISRLVANLQALTAESPIDSITIKAHPKAKHGIVVKAMNEAKLAGIQSVSVLVGQKS